MKATPYLHVSLGIAFAAVGTWVFFRNVNGPLLVSELRNQRLLAIVGCACLPLVSLWFRSIRLRLILPSSPFSNTKKLLDTVLIEFSVNNILPGRIGEVARALLLWKRNGFSATVSIGSIVVERVFDCLVILSFFFVPVFFVHGLHIQRIPMIVGSFEGNISLLTVALYAFGVFLSVFVVMVAYRLMPRATRAGAARAVKALPQAWQRNARVLGTEILATINFLFSFKRVLAIILLSIIIEAAYAASFLLLIAPPNAFGVLTSMFAQAFGSLGAAIPLAPGYIGTLHAMLLKGFCLAGYEVERSRATAIIYHALGFIAVTPIGLFLLAKSKTRLAAILKLRKVEVVSTEKES